MKEGESNAYEMITEKYGVQLYNNVDNESHYGVYL